MTREQTKSLFRRIKSHYQEFTIDDFKTDEWYKELKEYDYEDVTSRFELHLNSEEYGQMIPKLWFLKKGLRTIDEKKESRVYKNPVICQLCGRPIDLRLYDSHYQKCSAINYMQREIKRLYDKEVPKEQLESMNDDKFRNKYETLLSIVQNNPSYKEQQIVINIIFGKDTDVNVNEVIKSL